MKMKKTLNVLLWAMLFCAIATSVAAQSPRISIQGILKDANGVSVSDGTYAITFRLYNQATGGTHLWEEQANVEVVGGIYSHYLGSVTPLNTANFASVVYVPVRVGTFELTPRSELTYAPYTFASATVVCSGALGDIKYSILNPQEFAEENGDCWVPMDGRNIVGSRLSSKLGMNNLPDAGGMFLRGQEFANGPDNDPDRDSSSPIATMQSDGVKPHSHTMNNAGAHTHGYEYFIASTPHDLRAGGDYTSVRFGYGWQSRNTTTSGDHTHTINDNDGSETRPKNLNVWTYIRIN
jgi:hypothetical protein